MKTLTVIGRDLVKRRPVVRAMAGMDVEMKDVTELLGGGAAGTTPNVENVVGTSAEGGDSYSAEFTRTTLEAVNRDIQGDYENSEQSQDEIMLAAVKTVLEKSGNELFGKYAAKRWYRMSKEEWLQVAEGNMDPNSSPFPFKFLMSADKDKGRRVWAEIKGSMSDENALLVIKSSASVKATHEIKEDEIDNPKSKGMSSAPFRLYKAYLTLRAMAADPRVENAALITQIMRNLFKGKPKMYENKGGREPIKGDFRELPPVVVDVPLIHQPSPWGRGNREMRTARDITQFGKVNPRSEKGGERNGREISNGVLSGVDGQQTDGDCDSPVNHSGIGGGIQNVPGRAGSKVSRK